MSTDYAVLPYDVASGIDATCQDAQSEAGEDALIEKKAHEPLRTAGKPGDIPCVIDSKSLAKRGIGDGDNGEYAFAPREGSIPVAIVEATNVVKAHHVTPGIDPRQESRESSGEINRGEHAVAQEKAVATCVAHDVTVGGNPGSRGAEKAGDVDGCEHALAQ